MTIEYQAPTGLSGAYDPLLAQVDLSWTAAVDGVPQLFTSNGNYVVDATADHVQVTGIGGGGGGTGGTSQAGSGNAGGFGGYGGGGGAYAQATFSVASLGAGPVVVTIGAGGAGGAGQVTASPSGPAFDYGIAGSNGGSTSFGSVLVAGGGAGGVVGSLQQVAAGGVPAVTGGSSVITQAGGTGGVHIDSGSGFAQLPGTTTLAGAGGGSSGLLTTTLPQAGAASSVAGGVAGVNAIFTGSSGQPAPSNPYGTGNDGAHGVGASGLIGGSGGAGGGGTNLDLHTPSSYANVVSGNGGNGGGYGGGGGGGGQGASNESGVGTYQVATGAGGTGAPGVLQTWTYWLHTHDPYYIVYRNGVLLGVTAQGATSFDDFSPLAGANTYTVYASYDGVTLMSAASNPTTVTISSGKVYVSGKFSPANAFAPIMLINLKGVKPKIYPPVINPNMRSRR